MVWSIDLKTAVRVYSSFLQGGATARSRNGSKIAGSPLGVLVPLRGSKLARASLSGEE
ncbi:hypothetical protein I8748_13075 [Nostoc sp. CENA67]|uniref:Uncharacterized protein n=1 Tax=Amazonocrinis nigriterrae CENA67 TaxID=2794033 RepID=A0A8J7HSS9_9NOST|nr:hypothetical protein [Amazonocrinis nigriterrae]MBH8563103.1 hypothetical protein [Amazonocrinis nigriterrae CENA67]